MGKIIHSATWKSMFPGAQGYTDGAHSGTTDPPAANANLGDANGSPLSMQSWRDSGQTTVWSYTVPRNTLVEASQLLIQISAGGLWDFFVGSPAVEQNTPKASAVVKVDGNSVEEFQVWSRGNWQHASADAQTGSKGAWGAQNLGSRSEMTVPTLGNGVTLTSGQVIAVEITPTAIATPSNNGMLPQVFRFTVFASNATTGKRMPPIHASYRPVDQTASQVAFSFTVPADGIKLKSIMGYSEAGMPFVLARAELHLNDQLCQELGFLNATVWRTRGELLTIPLGFTLQAGDTLALRGCPLADTGGVISAQLIGTRRGVGYSRSR